MHMKQYESYITFSLCSQKEKKERKKSETEVEVDGTKELHVTLSPRTPAGDPPETEELIKALMVNINDILSILPDFVSSTIKYFIHTKINIESTHGACNGKRLHNSDTSTLIDYFFYFFLAAPPLSFSLNEACTEICL